MRPAPSRARPGRGGRGFTQALLDAGAALGHAVDAGTGQLRGWLRADPRVINLERTNLAQLGPHLISEAVNLITMDLSYLAVADAIGQIDRQLLAPATQLIALIKPTFELHAAALACRATPGHSGYRRRSPRAGRPRVARPGPERSPIPGAKGAVEAFVHAASCPPAPQA